MSRLFLAVAILCGVLGTTSMKLSDGFSNYPYIISMAICYAVSFSCLNVSLKKIDTSVAYAIWSGVGTVAISIIGVFLFKERFSFIKIAAIVLILTGTVMLNIDSSSN